MNHPSSLETERRALALFERLLDRPGNLRFRERLLRGATEEVQARVAALEARAVGAPSALPTRFDDLLPDDAPSLSPGTRIGAFRLTEPIGRGGMGEVWAAQRADGLFDQQVAIKLIQRRTSPRLLAAFDGERRILARLEHPNIARLIDGGVTEEGLPWLAMEFCDGKPLDQAAAGLPAAERMQLFVKAADALRFAHRRMIAHADIKPSNIVVGHDGRVKLLDFGIATLLDAAPHDSGEVGPMTREFASPQRLAGARPSVADDVFGLGRTLAAVLDGLADPELAAIAHKASAPDEADRYGSVDALIDDLERWRAQRPVRAVPATSAYRTRKFVERNRRWVVLSAIAIVLIGGISTYAARNAFQAEISRNRAEARSGEVRQLAHLLLYDLYDELARQPGTVAKREELAKQAARYLGQLQAERDASPAMRLDAARGYRRLAAIEGLPGISNLGEPDQALQSLAQAEAILVPLAKANPRDPQILAELGWVHADRWTLHADNIDSPTANREARRWFDAALALAPGDPSARLGQLTTAKSEGYDQIWSADQPAAAIPQLRTTLAALRRIAWPASYAEAVRMLEINVLNRLGDALYYAGDIPGSLAPYREADALVDGVIKAEGPAPQWLILKGESAFNVSGSLGDSGQESEGLRVADAGVAPLQQLLRSGPDAAAEKRLLVLYGQQAALLGALGRDADALVPSGASVALRQARLSRSPEDPQRMRDLAIGLAPHARLLAKAGRTPDACVAAARAVDVWQAIRRLGRLGALDERRNLPQSETLQTEYCAG